MPTVRTPNLPQPGAGPFRNRRNDIDQRRIAMRIARGLPGVDGKTRFSLRLWLPLGRPRVYRLKGYATLKNVRRKLLAGRTQRFLWRLLIVAVLLIAVAYLLLRLNPFENLPEIFRMLGITK